MIKNGIIVCGPRDYEDWEFIWGECDRIIIPFAKRMGGNIIIVHGDCPTGVDSHVDKWAAYRLLSIDRHPADWNRHGKRGGPIRNGEMAALPFVYGCLGFEANPPTSGTSDMLRKADKAGLIIRTVQIPMNLYYAT